MIESNEAVSLLFKKLEKSELDHHVCIMTINDGLIKTIDFIKTLQTRIFNLNERLRKKYGNGYSKDVC